MAEHCGDATEQGRSDTFTGRLAACLSSTYS